MSSDEAREDTYILTSDLTRVRIVKEICRQMSPGSNPSIPDDQYHQVTMLLGLWEADMERRQDEDEQE